VGSEDRDVGQLGLEQRAEVPANGPAGEAPAGRIPNLAAHRGDDVLGDRRFEREDLRAFAAIDRAAHGILDHRV